METEERSNNPFSSCVMSSSRARRGTAWRGVKRNPDEETEEEQLHSNLVVFRTARVPSAFPGIRAARSPRAYAEEYSPPRNKVAQ